MFDFPKNKNTEKGGVLVLFDIGGTKTRVTVSRDGKTFDEPKIVSTPKDFNEGIALFKKLTDEATGDANVVALCGGVPGVLSKDGATIFKLPNLPEWDGKAILSEFEKIFNAPVYLENDSALAALGEAVFGAGVGHSIVAYMTVSTGVGGARIVGGKIDEKVFDFEPGHEIIDASGKDLESYISGSSVRKHFGKYPAGINDPAILNELASQLAIGLNNVVLFWSPNVIVLGGSMITGINPIPLDKVEEKLRELLKIFPEIPQIKKAVLGDEGGLYGALEYAKQKLSQ